MYYNLPSLSGCESVCTYMAPRSEVERPRFFNQVSCSLGYGSVLVTFLLQRDKMNKAAHKRQYFTGDSLTVSEGEPTDVMEGGWQAAGVALEE